MVVSNLILAKVNTLIVTLLILASLLNLQSCCLSKPPEQVAGVLVVFEGINDADKSKAWVIETAQGNPDEQIDTTYYGALHHLTSYSFFLDFRTTGQNGDYYIYADSVKGINVITEMDLWTDTDKCENEKIYYNYKFNGFLQTQANQRIVVYQAQL